MKKALWFWGFFHLTCVRRWFYTDMSEVFLHKFLIGRRYNDYICVAAMFLKPNQILRPTINKDFKIFEQNCQRIEPSTSRSSGIQVCYTILVIAAFMPFRQAGFVLLASWWVIALFKLRKVMRIVYVHWNNNLMLTKLPQFVAIDMLHQLHEESGVMLSPSLER